MVQFSQNKKIAISAIALFAISFSTMVFFLGGDVKMGSELEANVMGAGGHSSSESKEQTVNANGFSTDVSGNITVAGKDFCKLLNQKCEDIIKQPIYKYVNKDDFSELSEVLGKLATSAQSIDSIGPIRVSANEDKEKMIILSAQSLQNSEGKITSLNFSVKDITDKVDGSSKKTDDANKAWMDAIYPKIKDINTQSDSLMKKLSFHY